MIRTIYTSLAVLICISGGLVLFVAAGSRACEAISKFIF